MAQIFVAQDQVVAFPQLEAGLSALEDRITPWAGDQNAFEGLLRSLFCSEFTPSAAWHQAALDLRQRLLGAGLQLSLTLSSDGTLAAQGIRAGYIGQVPSTQPRQGLGVLSNHDQPPGTSVPDHMTAESPVGINSSPNNQIVVDAHWLASARPAEVEAVLLEELGHAIDNILNGSIDRNGDEGEIFSALMRGESSPQNAQAENDNRLVIINSNDLVLEASLMADNALPNPDSCQAFDLDGDNSSPEGETVSNLFDGTISKKYVNFGRTNSGLEFGYARPTKINGFALATANDSPERDPASYSLYALNSSDNSWVEITAGNLSLPASRSSWAQTIAIANSSHYSRYRLIFPSLKNGNQANSMQLAELRFYGEQRNSPVVSSAATSKIYRPGDAIEITVNYLAPVTVSGSPILLLATANGTAVASFSSISNDGKALIFKYIVQSGDISSNLDVASTAALQLPIGVSIKNTDQTPAILILPVGANKIGSLAYNKNIIVYGQPSVLPTPDSYVALDLDGDSGSPNLEGIPNAFDGNISTKYLNYGKTNSGFEFSYARPTNINRFSIVTADDSPERDPASYVLYAFNQAENAWKELAAGSLSLPELRGSLVAPISIENASYYSSYRLIFPTLRNGIFANSMQLGEILFVGNQKNAPIINCSAPSRTYRSGETIQIEVNYLNPVDVSGEPVLKLETGDIDREAKFSSISDDGKTLFFQYTVQSGDFSPNLDVASAASLQLPIGASIKNDDSTINAILTVPVGASSVGSLANSKALVVDGRIIPNVIGVNSSNANGTFKIGNTLAITVSFSDPVIVAGSPTLKLETGTNDRIATYQSISTDGKTLSFNYTVQSGDSSADLDAYSAASLILPSGASILHASGTAANLNLPVGASTSGSLANAKDLVIDGTPLFVSNQVEMLRYGGYEKTTTNGKTSYRFLSESELNLKLFGGDTLRVNASQLTVENGLIQALQGTATGTGAYGLSQLQFGSLAIDRAASSQSISGTAKLGSQSVSLSGDLKLEANNQYSFLPVTVSGANLASLLPATGHLQELTNSKFGFVSNAAGTNLVLSGSTDARFDLRPDQADISTPYPVSLTNLGLDSNQKVNSFKLTPKNQAPWPIKLAGATISANSETITYSLIPASEGKLAQQVFTVDLNGTLTPDGGDSLTVDGQMTYRYSVPASGAPTLLPVSAHFDILNTTPFSIGGTRFKTSGGLKLDYQEDANRSAAILALNGEAKIDLEVIKGLPVQLGSPTLNFSDLLASADLAGKALPATNGWSLGQLKEATTGRKEDLGLATITKVALTSGDLRPKFYDPVQNIPAFENGAGPTLKQLSGSLGLFTITPIATAYTDQFKVFGLDGKPISTVVLDLVPSSTNSAAPQISLKRQEILTNKERLDLYAAYVEKESASGDVTLTAILDQTKSQEINGFSKYFKAGTQKTDFGSVTINDTGVWTYNLDTSNSTLAPVSGGYTIVPRVNTQTGLIANLSNVELQLNAVLVGLRPEADAILDLLDSFGIRKFVKTLEKEVDLPSYEPLRNTLLKLFESVPGNAYADGKLQVIEIIDTLYYTATRLNKKSSKGYVALTPTIKGLGKVIGFAEGVIAQTWKSSGRTADQYFYANSLFRDEKDGTPYQFDNILLDLVYHNDNTANPGYTWLDDAIVSRVGKLPEKVNLSTLYDDPLEQIQAQNSYRKYLKSKGAGQEEQAAGDSTFSVSLDSQPLFAPTEFINRYLTEDQLDLLRLDLALDIAVNAEVSYPLFPLVSALFGATLNVELLLNIISRLSRDQLNTLILSINVVKADASLSDTAKQSAVDKLIASAFSNSLSTDLSADKFKIGIEPYVGIQLGFPLLNITGKMGLAVDFTVGFERLLNGDLADDQTVSLADFFGKSAGTKSPYAYNPKFESLNFTLDHNYDFLLAKSPTDKSGFADFRTAYAQNSWLFNIYFEPINLKALIGESKLAFDVSLLKKLGNKLITSFDWVNIVDERIVTAGGIDLLFKDAKYLNSPVSSAFNAALKRQYPKLTDKERARLLSLIIDNASPTRITYALADTQKIDQRINELQSSYVVRAARDIGSPSLSKDKFRYRYDTVDAENAVDVYSYYSLYAPKYIDIKPKLAYNFVEVQIDLISTGAKVNTDLQFFDGSRWQTLGSLQDDLKGAAKVTMAATTPGIVMNYDETVKANPGHYVHNAGTLSLQLSLAHLSRSDANPQEKLLKQLAEAGQLQLRLFDETTSGVGEDTTFISDPRIMRGGSIYTKRVDSGNILRQDNVVAWNQNLVSGAVQWISPSFFRPLSDQPDLAFLNQQESTRSQKIGQYLNPTAPLAIQFAGQQLSARPSSHSSASQSGTLSDVVDGTIRFTRDPITSLTYKSYIGSDRHVRVAVRSAADQDWVDVANLADLALSPTETQAPDLVAINGEVVLASWDANGNLLRYSIKLPTTAGSQVQISSAAIDHETLARVTLQGTGPTNRLESAQQPGLRSNTDLRIGLEKRLDLNSSSSLNQAFYLSVVDPIQQVYATSAQPLSMTINNYTPGSAAQTLTQAANAWIGTAQSSPLKKHLSALLGFNEYSNSGVFSGTGANSTGNIGVITAADFIEYNSTADMANHLAEWGSGSLFVASSSAIGNGEAMIWNYDGDAYTRNNQNRLKPESVTSSGRVYSMNGLTPDSLSVVYRNLDQKDIFTSNWAGLVDQSLSPYSQVGNKPMRTAALHDRDSLVAGGNLAILATGKALNFGLLNQPFASTDQLGARADQGYALTDGTDVVRYFSPERFSGNDGLNYWYDASNVAPLNLQSYQVGGLDPAHAATAALNSSGAVSGLGWAWLPARQLSDGQLDSLIRTSGLSFIDSHSLNLVIGSATNEFAANGQIHLNPASIQLLPSSQTPELFLGSQASGSAKANNFSILAGPRSEVGVVLTANELKSPSWFTGDSSLTSYDLIGSLFAGSRPFLYRGDYVPLAYYNEGDNTYYGNLNAPVLASADQAFNPASFQLPKTANAVTPIGFEGSISDYFSFGVDQAHSKDILSLIKTMPAVVPAGYFRMVDPAGTNLNPGTVVHAPMVPMRSTASNKQLIYADLSPTSSRQSPLYVASSDPVQVSLGRNEPPSVILQRMEMVGTYVPGIDSIDKFAAYAWNDPQLKYSLLDDALPVDAFGNAADWLAEFRRRYAGLEIPRSIEFVSQNTPQLVNNTLFTPVAANGEFGSYLNLPYANTNALDQINLTTTIESTLKLSAEVNALFLSFNVASLDIPLHKPYVKSWKIASLTGGPLAGTFDLFFDENRDLSRNSSEISDQGLASTLQLDLSSRASKILLDTSVETANLWNGTDYQPKYQNGSPDWRSGLLVIRPASNGSAVDVMTGLANTSTYLSKLEANVADTHWESIKNSVLLDYIPYSAKNITSIDKSRWFTDRSSLTKLVPSEIAAAFTSAFVLPTGLDAELSDPIHVYDAFGAADAVSKPNLLNLYSFENRMMAISTLIREIYKQAAIDSSQLESPNAPAGYDPEIYAYQVIPYFALTLAGKTDPYYRKLLTLIAESMGGKNGSLALRLEQSGYKFNPTNSDDLALLLGFAQLTMPSTNQNLTFYNGRLDLSYTAGISDSLAKMRLKTVATSLSDYLDAFDLVASKQFSLDPRFITTAVSALKRQILAPAGVISEAASAIVNQQPPTIPPVDPKLLTQPVTPESFTLINQTIRDSSDQSTQVIPGVAGLARSLVVDQVYKTTEDGIYEFNLRLSQPAPSGGALFLLNYDGSAVYGTDYKLNGFVSRPDYFYVPAGETSQSFKIDVSASQLTSSLLIHLAAASADYQISSGFDRMLFEIDAGKAKLLEQQDKVVFRQFSNQIQVPLGESIFTPSELIKQAGTNDIRIVGSQPKLTDRHVTVNAYQAKLNPSNIRFAAQAPNDAEVTGGWGLIGKNLYRAHAGDWGAVDIYELRNQASGIYTYVNSLSEYQILQAQGWLGNGVAFSFDEDHSLPLRISSVPAASPPLSLPGFDLQAISGYLDTYEYASNQDISEWRFLGKISGLKFKDSFTLDGAIMVRHRQDYADETWWIDADVLGFDLPNLATISTGVGTSKANGHLNLRLSNGQLNQWQIQADVNDFKLTDGLSLSGSLDLYYENSKATQNKSRYRASGRVKDFDFSTPGFQLQNLDVSLTDFLLNDGKVLSWSLATSVQDLLIGDQFRVSGSLNLSYLTDNLGSHLQGDAALKSFNLDLGSGVGLDVAAGTIEFAVDNGKLATASLDLQQAKLKINQSNVLNFTTGSLDLSQTNGNPDSFDLEATLTASKLGPLTIDHGLASIHYKRSFVPGTASAHQELSLGLTKSDLSLDLGSSVGVQTLKGVTAAVNLLDGSIVGYQLAASEINLQLGPNILAKGTFSLLNEAVGSDVYTHAAIKANQLSLSVPNALSFAGSAGLEFTIKNQALTTLKLSALAKDVTIAGFALDGNLDLQLDHFVNGTPEDIRLSAGIQNFNLGLASSPTTTLTGEVQDLTIHKGEVQQWTLIGAINDFAISNQFKASGFARLNYTKKEQNKTLTGSVGVTDFKLLLPAGPSQASINGQLDFNLVNDQLQRWKLIGGVDKLKLVDGIEISGELSMEYLDQVYPDNPYKQDVFLLDATLKQASFKLTDDVTLKLDGSLSDLTFNGTGDVLAWKLKSSVRDLELFDGFKISGNLDLKYKFDAGVKIFDGAAEVTGVSLPVPGLSNPSQGMTGKLAFQTRNNELQQWTLTADVDQLNLFNDITITGHVEIGRTLSNPIQNRLKASVQSMKLALGTGIEASLSGQMDLAYKTYDGSIYPIEQTLTFQATRAQLSIANLFSVDGSADVKYSQALNGQKDFSMTAKVNAFNLVIPGGSPVVLKGDLSVDLRDSVLQSFKLNSSVSSLKLGLFELDGNIEVAYALPAAPTETTAGSPATEGIYSLRGDFTNLSLKSPDPNGGSLTLDKGLVALRYGNQSGILDWNLAASILNWKLFDDFVLSGAAQIYYTKKNQFETYTIKASVDTFKLDLGFSSEPLSLSGKFALVTTNGELDQWSLAASVQNLNLLGFSLDGDIDLDYQKRNASLYNQTTFIVSKASIGVDVLGGYFAGTSANVSVSDLVLVEQQGRQWQAMSWQASAKLAIGNEASTIQLKSTLDISYLHQDPLFGFKDTLTMSGAVKDFRITSDYFSVHDVDLILEKLVVVGGEASPRSLKFNGRINDLNIANIFAMSGSFSGLFDNSKGLDFDVQGSIDRLRIAGFDLFDYLSISSGEVSASSKGSRLDVNLTAKFKNDSKISIGGFDLAFKDTSATIQFTKLNDNDAGKLSFSAQGLMELGSAHTPVSGGFSASIDLATGKPSLDDLTLSLTPDDKPADYGIFKLDAPSSLRYKNGEIKLILDPSVNADIFNGFSAPIYDSVNSIRPAVEPVIDLLTTQIPNDFATPEQSIVIPSIKLPTLQQTGTRRGLFGLTFPVYSVVLKEVVPEFRKVVIPKLDIGAALTNFIESYPGNPYKNGKLEVIELLDGLGATFFYVNQKLAQAGLFSDAFEPYISIFGKKAYTMAYPSISPIVGTLDTLLGMTELATKQPSLPGWVRLDPFSLVYNINTGKLDVKGPALGDIASKFGAFGNLYDFTNNTLAATGSGSLDGNFKSVGFVNNSSFKVPILDNPAKAILDVILDKPVDVFEYNLDLSASLKARGSVDLGSWVAALIGVPIPLILGANPGLDVNLDTTVGFTASPKALKTLAADVQALLSGQGKFDDILRTVITGITEPNTGVYLDISNDLLTLKPELSVDLSLDYKVLGLRGQIGLSSTLSAALDLLGNGAPDRIYLNNLVRPLFDPDFKKNRTPYDLVLALKPGKTTVWFDILAKVASPWFSVFRLQSDLPIPKISLQIPLGTVYTGPTYGPTSLYFQPKLKLQDGSSHPDLVTDFYSGFADQQGLFDRIAGSITADQPQGVLYVAPSPWSRDVLTGIPRSLALFDQVSSTDPTPDVLNVSTSLDSTAALMQSYATTVTASSSTASVLEQLTGYSSSFSTSQSSYQLLHSDSVDVRRVGLAQLQFEYQLQAVLIAIQDLLRAHDVLAYRPAGYGDDLPQDEALWPYMFLQHYLSHGSKASAPGSALVHLDLQDARSLKALFVDVETRIGNPSPTRAGCTASAIAALNREMVTRSNLGDSLDGPALLAPLAITGLKQIFQGHSLEMALDLLQQQPNQEDALLASWISTFALAHSSQTADTYASVAWRAADAGHFSLQLSHAATEAGAFVNVLLRSSLVYGEDYRLKGFERQPVQLFIVPGSDHLDLQFEWLKSDLPTSSVDLTILASHSGLQPDPNRSGLHVTVTGTTALASVQSFTVNQLASDTTVLNANAQGVFTLATQSTPYVLMGFDRSAGHRLAIANGATANAVPLSLDQLTIINGVLYAGPRAIGVVLAETLGQPGTLAYADNLGSASHGRIALRLPGQTLVEDQSQPLKLSLAALLQQANRQGQTLVNLSTTARLQVQLDQGEIMLHADPDFAGSGALLLTLANGEGVQSVVEVPITVTSQVDPLRRLQPLSLQVDEDSRVELPFSSFTDGILDVDHFAPVTFESLSGPNGSPAPVSIEVNRTDQSVLIRPAADIHGEQTLTLTVSSHGVASNFDVKLTINPINDGARPESLDLALAADGTHVFSVDDFPFLDPDGDGIDAIHITQAPYGGSLRWLNNPGNPLTASLLFDPVTQPFVTLDQLRAGQLIYQADPPERYPERFQNYGWLVDVLGYQLVQNLSTQPILSSLSTLILTDERPDEGLLSPPQITNHTIDIDGKRLKAHFSFDQPLHFDGHSLRLLGANDAAAPSSVTVVKEIDPSSADSGVQLSADGLSLTLAIERPTNVQGYLAVDLGARGDLLRNRDGLALALPALQYGIKYDSAPPKLLSQAFTVKDASVTLQLEFSEDVHSLGWVRLAVVNPITGAIDQVAEIQPSSTPTAGLDPLNSSTVLFNFTDLIAGLTVLPGSSYRLLFDSDTGLRDSSGNVASVSTDITIPYPQTPEFQLAKSQAVSSRVLPYSFYFSLVDAQDKESTATLLPFAQPLSGITFAADQITTSRVINPVASGQDLQLQLWLYGQDRNKLGLIDLELVFPSNEVWFDTDQLNAIAGLHVLEYTGDLGTGRDGLLRLRLDPSFSATTDDGGRRLVSLPFLTLPVGSGEFQPDTSPPIVLRRVGSVLTGESLDPSQTSLPQLLLTKHNSLTNQQAALLIHDPMINEGATLSIHVATSLAPNSTLYWRFSGNGISADDFIDGALDGSGKVNTDGKITIAIDVANDLAAERDEVLHIQLYSDSALTIPFGQAAEVTIRSRDLRVGNGSFDPKLFKLTKVDFQSLLPKLGAVIGGRSSDYHLNAEAVQFTAQLSKSATKSLNTALDLSVVGGSLDLVDDQGVRRANRRLAYFSIDSADPNVVSTLTYNPLKRAGARFYDRDGDGVAEFLSLALVDGGYGDKDHKVNGSILDPSTAATVDINPILSRANANTLTVSDPGNANAPASLVLRASLSGRPSTSNQIGYVVLEASELAIADSLLSNWTTVTTRAQTLFSTLEREDVTLNDFTSFDREILLVNGQSVRFFEVSDGTLDEITGPNDSRFQFLSMGIPSAQALAVTSLSGVQFNLSLLSSDQGLNALVAQEQGSASLLDFSSFKSTEKVTGTLVLAREASYDSITGFYRTVDTLGSVLDANGDLLTPGVASVAEYMNAALRIENLVSELSGIAVANGQTSSRVVEVSESTYLAPFARVNGDTFFAFGDANIDRFNHFRVLGNNIFGLEDLSGGGDRDFDDLVFGFSFSRVQ